MNLHNILTNIGIDMDDILLDSLRGLRYRFVILFTSNRGDMEIV